MNDEGRAARAGMETPEASSHPSLVRIKMSPPAYHAICASCFRQSPIFAGDEHEVRARVAELGWTSSAAGVLCCPICARRAAPPVRRVSRPTRMTSGVTTKARPHDGVHEPAPAPAPAPKPAPSGELLDGGLCDSLPE